MAAKEERLSLLHEKLTDLFLEMVEEHAEDIPSATLKTMTSFLKDNEITCQDENSGVGSLREKLAEKKKHLASVQPISKEM